MLQTLKRLAGWSEQQKAEMPRTLAPDVKPTDSNDVYWGRLFGKRCQPHGAVGGRGGFCYNPKSLPAGEAWMLEDRFPFRSASVVEAFLAWAGALVCIEDLGAEASRVKAMPADLDGAVRVYMQLLEEERAGVVAELLGGTDAGRFYDPARRNFHSLAGLLGDAALSAWEEQGAETFGESANASADRFAREMCGRLYMLAFTEADVRAWLSKHLPAGATISDQARAAKLAELQAGIDSAKAEADQLGQASGRIDGEGRDTWLGHYYAARILNASSAAPCDACGREADEKTASALAVLGVVNGLRTGSLFMPTGKALEKFAA